MCSVSVGGLSVCLVKYGYWGRVTSSVPLVFEPLYSIFFNACLSIKIF